ncbi:hypothetical protein AOL_s00075g80 [Orbilia oligospora ATCC 24927]|uniref:Uncharacterized protein n=1 Tax=Arthrobotrys oligospora (strain ATCC 24927 / CBS 115.81 / DSM 1491) TaxID=756982 RepID=G1X881_ARTOA|nr:hypothetical protein AOL_s00075g80 [Orbilia oligospora ATCC 24927]EGX50654.1 hypothetical protein AOL_s00075g80 [Orbilia oligospora ATCC 24927]
MDATTKPTTTQVPEPSPKPKSHHDYTVGWVCALPKEQTAAFAMLDKQHPDLPIPLTDKNSYILGEIRGHNVVIACLPSGQIGNNPAVAVATRMISTFQSIRFGLMVGIGGGAPSKVRLGDVVVSTPFGRHPGVVQWDFGKMEKGFRRTGALNPPPTLLLTAISKLRTIVEAKGTQIPTYMEELRNNHPRLAPKYAWNGSLKDPYLDETQEATLFAQLWEIILFLISFIFGRSLVAPTNGPKPQSKDRASTCTEPEIKQEEPCIHYGLIASGNQVIKNAKFRDSISGSLGGNVLCFEMEAAGLMADFPCIVIRGICDYADTKKAKDWQEYAAAMAAAYAKEPLSYVQSVEVQREKPARDIMDQVLDYTTAIKSRLDRDEDLKVLAWLTKVDYGPRQSDIFQNRQPNTGIWFLNSPEYQSWLSSQEKQILFCPGIPGAGKTFITSIVVNHLTNWFSDDETIGTAYIYCNFKEALEQNFDHLLSSLLKQLTQTRPSLPEVVRKLYKQHLDKKTRPLNDEIVKALHSVAATYSRVFIIIDALDECREDDDCRTNFISELLKLHDRINGVNLFITSRPIPEIEKEFWGNPTRSIRAYDEDVRKYLIEKVSRSKNTKVKECEELVVNGILEAVDGMFLLAELYFESVRTKTSKKKIRIALDTFGKQSGFSTDAYKRAYEGAMERIKSHNKDSEELAKQVLMWVVYATRPLTVSELQCALAVEIGTHAFDEENIPDINRMISVCAGLVIMEENSKIMRLVHYTAQEYFEDHPQALSLNCHNDILEVCATYLSYDIFETGPCESVILFFAMLKLNALYEYASHDWVHHAYKSSVRATPLVMGLLQNQKKLEACNQIHTLNDDRWNKDKKRYDKDKVMTGLCFAACFGLEGPVAAFLSAGADTETWEHRSGATPLSGAVICGHGTVVKLLLENGANIEAKGYSNHTPLHLAVIHKHEAIVGLLLNSGADIEARDIFDHTPLALAAIHGNKSIASLLIEKGADIEAKGDDGCTLLLFAAMNGRAEIVELLLHNGANSAAKNNLGHGLLSVAAIWRHAAVVKLLLNYGADIEANDGGLLRY